eukprot:SAG22_NODE_865_length_6783_cov_23.880461_3_plen_221_part_00
MWPLKANEDNMFRASAEIHVLLTITSASYSLSYQHATRCCAITSPVIHFLCCSERFVDLTGQLCCALVRTPAAFVMKMPEEVMRHEKLDTHFYDVVLFSSLIACVPFAMLCAVAAKLWRAWKGGLLAGETGPKAAHERWRFGLASAQDRRELREYFASLASPPAASDGEGADSDAGVLVPSFRSTWAGSSSSLAAAPPSPSPPLAVKRDRNALGVELRPM